MTYRNAVKNLPIMSLNQEFRVVFQPKETLLYNGKRRFAIGAGSIAKYVGEKNAQTAITKALAGGEDRFTIKFRKHGRIDFYVK